MNLDYVRAIRDAARFRTAAAPGGAVAPSACDLDRAAGRLNALRETAQSASPASAAAFVARRRRRVNSRK